MEDQINSQDPDPQNSNLQPKWKVWLKRVGFWGFMFFLIKGLAWIFVPILIAKGCMK